jgi:RNA polymerase sigma-70 factor (ECF subfamily)
MAEERAENGVPEDGDPGRICASSRRNPLPQASGSDGGASGEAVTETVARCRLGDRSAQRRLYDSFNRMVYRLMVRIVGPDDAPDLTQQIFLQVFRKIGQYSGRGRFDRWLYRLAVNEAFQHLRRKRRTRHRALVYEPVDDSARGDERTERKDLMEQALARLDPELRSICLLREIEGLSYREIAETLDIPEGTVGSRLNRARRDLKQHLINLGWEP